MTTTAHVFIAVVTLLSFVFVVRLVRRHRLQSKYSMLWLAIAAMMVILATFPGLVDNASYAVGVDYPPAAFLAVAVTFLFVVIVQFSWELSRLDDRTRVLAEEVALLRLAQSELSERLDAPSGATRAGRHD